MYCSISIQHPSLLWTPSLFYRATLPSHLSGISPPSHLSGTISSSLFYRATSTSSWVFFNLLRLSCCCCNTSYTSSTTTMTELSFLAAKLLVFTSASSSHSSSTGTRAQLQPQLFVQNTSQLQAAKRWLPSQATTLPRQPTQRLLKSTTRHPPSQPKPTQNKTKNNRTCRLSSLILGHHYQGNLTTPPTSPGLPDYKIEHQNQSEAPIPSTEPRARHS